MPKLIDLQEVKLDFGDPALWTPRLPPTTPRHPGTHLSGILRHIGLSTGLLVIPSDPALESSATPPAPVGSKGSVRLVPDIDEEEYPLRMALGVAWENYAQGLYPEMAWQPGELELDGVYGNCDGYNHLYLPAPAPDGEFVIEEFKLTWKSRRTYAGERGERFTQANWMWMCQGMGYGRMISRPPSPPVTACRYHICWVNGNYRPPQPQYFRYTVRFTPKELEGNWSMVQKHKDHPAVIKET